MNPAEPARARIVADDFCIPQMGCVPPLANQFEGFAHTDFTAGLRLLRADYEHSRAAWEQTHDLVFPEFRYLDRIHPLSERPALLRLRGELLGDAEMADAVDHEFRFIKRAMFDALMIACAREELPVAVIDPAQTVVRARVPYGHHAAPIPEQFADLVEEGKRRFDARKAELFGESNQPFLRELFRLSHLRERCEALEYQSRLLGARD